MKEQVKEKILDQLKKFWFVILVGVIFISFAIFFAWDTNKDKIPGKSVDGKDVIFTLDDVNYTADEYYNTLFDTATDGSQNGVAFLYTLLEKKVAELSDSTDKMEKQADTIFEQFEATYKSQYGDNYEAYMGNQLKQLGYNGVDELRDYLLNQLKLDAITLKYINKHDELVKTVFTNESPRAISHILVKCADPNNPTAEEQAKMDSIKKAIDDGQKFSKVAAKSDDTANAAKGGSLGLQLHSASLDEAFKTAAWELKEGQMSGWVKSSFGYHLILIDTADQKEIMKNDEYSSTIIAKILNDNTNLKKQIVWDEAQKDKVVIKDKKLKEQLLTYMGVKK